MNTFNIIRDRWSVRSFEDAPVKKDDLDAMLEAGRLAPTAKNQQPFHIYVLESDEALACVDRATSCRYGSRTVLLLTALTDKVWVNPFDEGHTSVDVDPTIVADTMILAGWERGVGSCWVDYFNPEVLQEGLDLRINERPVHLIPLGYPAEGARPAPRHFVRKNLDELVTWM